MSTTCRQFPSENKYFIFSHLHPTFHKKSWMIKKSLWQFSYAGSPKKFSQHIFSNIVCRIHYAFFSKRKTFQENFFSSTKCFYLESDVWKSGIINNFQKADIWKVRFEAGLKRQVWYLPVFFNSYVLVCVGFTYCFIYAYRLRKSMNNGLTGHTWSVNW